MLTVRADDSLALAERNLARDSRWQGETQPQSAYVQYLPAIYGEDPFVGRFLLIFESILGPLDARIGGLPALYDPAKTPPDFLPWLAGWLGLVLDENWPLERRRALVREGAELYRWRGTKRGLGRYLEIYTGVRPSIADTPQGFTLGDAHLGLNATLGRPAPAHTFIVSFTLPDDARKDFNETTVRHIIETEKPAHTAYILEVG